MRPLGPILVSRDRHTDHPAYRWLLAEASVTGCCPVWLGDPDALQVPDDVHDAVAATDAVDPAAFLARRWPRNCPLCGCRDPFGDTFPGLAGGHELLDDPVTVAAEWAEGARRARLAVVPVARPADIVAAVGWTGPGNHGTDLPSLSAVLRGWEDRFGAFLVQLDRATLWLSVAAPPSTERECRAVAAEHFAFCPDVGWEDPRPLRVYATTLLGRREWRFWWD